MGDNWFYRLVGVTRGKYFLPKAKDELSKDPRPPVLYLRAFADELSEYSLKKAFQAGPEDHAILAGSIRLIGPYIAIGRPNEPFPELGATRMYVCDEEWREVVGRLIDVSAAFVVQGSPSNGLAWELSELVRRTTPSKLLLLLPRSSEGYQEFRLWANRLLPKPLPVSVSKQTTSIGLRFLAFYSDWEPYELEAKGLPWTLFPFFRQNDFPFPQKSAAQEKREKLLARVTAELHGAVEAYRAEVALSERVAAAWPKNAGWQREIALAHEQLGDVLHAFGDVVGARAEYKATTGIMERLAAADVKNTAWTHVLASTRAKIERIESDSRNDGYVPPKRRRHPYRSGK